MNRSPALSLSICTFIMLLIVPRLSHGQIQFGVLGGANFTSLENITASNEVNVLDNQSGYHLGAFLDIGNESFGVRPGIYYLNAGPLFKGSSFINEDNFNLNYLAMPIDLRFSLGVRPIRPYLITGPEFHVLAFNDIPGDLRDKLHSFVVDWSVGAGIAIGMPNAGLVLYPQLRYNFAVSAIIDEEFELGGIPITTNGRASSLWLLSLGIGF